MQNWKPFGALGGLCFLWGTTYLAIRIGVAHFPPFLFSGIRFIISGGAVVLWFALRKNTRWPSVIELRNILLSGGLIFIGGNLLLCLAEQRVPSGLAALVNTAFPLWIVIITRLWNPVEKTPLLALAGILTGFAGQLLIFYDQIFLLSNAAYYIGGILLVVGVINGALGSVYMKKHPVTISPVLTGGLQMLISGCITTTVGVVKGEGPLLNDNIDGWLSLLYLVVAGSILGYSLFVYAMHHLPAQMVSVYAYVNPIVALFLGSVFLHEVVSTQTIIAMCITLAGVYIVNRGMTSSLRKSSAT